MPGPDGLSRYDATRVPVPEGHDLLTLCVCCRHAPQPVVRDGLWAKCKRCDRDCTNVGCRTLPPRRTGIFGRLVRVRRSRLFR